MTVEPLPHAIDRVRMRAFMQAAFPLCRSITGEGVRETLKLVGRHLDQLDFKQIEVPTGTRVLDWTVPNEWNLRRATLDGPDGRVLDSEESNLHVVSYSCPVDTTVSLAELRPHLHSLPHLPDAVPYRTSYYQQTWGFCLTDKTLAGLREGDYRVRIDSSLEPGHLSYGELFLPGSTSQEILLTTHICHPSMANDNLSGIAALTEVARILADDRRSRPLGVRLLFIPGTIGSITWLAANQPLLGSIKAGLVLAGVGDHAPATYKRSRQATGRIDLVMERLVRDRGGSIIDYYPYGYDERQFCSPGFDLPVGRLSRSMHGTYPEYHTSLDDLDFVDDDILADSVALVLDAIEALQYETRYQNLAPYGEPQLGRRGLYGNLGGAIDTESVEMGLLWLLAYGDGEHSIVDIERLCGIDPDSLRIAARALQRADLLKRL